MKIALGFDHAGIKRKAMIIDYLKSHGYDYEDYGTFSEESCNYAEYGAKVAEAVKDGKADRGVLVCGTGIGMSIVANKVPTIRCGHCTDVFSAVATRSHNNANVLAMGERITDEDTMLKILEAFLTTEFEGGRHEQRIAKITEIENKYIKK